MLKGFRDFLMRGNLIDVAVAFVIGVAFTAVTTSFTAVVIEILAKIGGAPDFKSFAPWGLTSVGPFLTALVSFVIMAFVIYFGIVVPYERIKKLSPPRPTPRSKPALRPPRSCSPRSATCCARADLSAARCQLPWCGGTSCSSRRSSALSARGTAVPAGCPSN